MLNKAQLKEEFDEILTGNSVDPKIANYLSKLFEKALKQKALETLESVELEGKPVIDYSKPENKYAEMPKRWMGYNDAVKDLEQLKSKLKEK